MRFRFVSRNRERRNEKLFAVEEGGSNVEGLLQFFRNLEPVFSFSVMSEPAIMAPYQHEHSTHV